MKGEAGTAIREEFGGKFYGSERRPLDSSHLKGMINSKVNKGSACYCYVLRKIWVATTELLKNGIFMQGRMTDEWALS